MFSRLNIYEKWVKSRNAAFISLLEFNPKAKVVDLGCGNGEFTLRAKEKIGCDEIIGVDADEERLNEAEKKGIAVVNHDLNDALPFKDNSFDVVISNQVIEHLYYPVKFMREVYRILKPKDYAVISTENLVSWDNLFALFFGYTPFSIEFDNGLYKIGNPLSPHEKETIKKPFPHVRVFAWKGLIELAKFVRFKIEKAVGSGHVLDRLGEIINKKRLAS